MLELIITNAVFVNPADGDKKEISVGICGGKIVHLGLKGEALPEAMAYLDAGGAYLVPDMIDFHTHLFTRGSGFGVNADLLLSSGVTLAVDMGTAGSAGYEAFHQTDVISRTMPVKSFINLSPLGQPGSGLSEPLKDSIIQEDKIRELMEKYPDEICGIKVRISREIVGELELEPLDHAVRLGEQLGKPVCVHTTNPPKAAAEIVKRLRSGDIYSHMYHGKGLTVIGDDGKVPEEFYLAQRRGVFLEVGNGKMNFNFEVAQKAMKAGIYPDIISSDATVRTFENAPDMKDLPFVMSKFWNMGMPLHAVLAAVTSSPARCLGMDSGSGYLQEGKAANLTLLRRKDEEVEFTDSDGNVYMGNRRLSPEMTMLNGRIVYLQGSARLQKHMDH